MTHPRLGVLSTGLAVFLLAANAGLVAAWILTDPAAAWKHGQGFLNFVFPTVLTPFLHIAGLILGIIGAWRIRKRKDLSATSCVLGIVLNTVVAVPVWIFVALMLTPVRVH